MQSEFMELVKVVGTFALFVIAAIVLLMLLVSLVDKYLTPKSKPNKDEDNKAN
jgi:membrane protein implicated in regulation of membrane protease activity